MQAADAAIQPGQGLTAWNHLMNNRENVHAQGVDAAISDLVADIHAVPANHLSALGNAMINRIIKHLPNERIETLPRAVRAVLFPDRQEEDSDDSSSSEELAGPFSGLVDTAENILWLVKTAQGALEVGKRSDMLVCAGTTLIEAVDKFFKGEWYGAAIQAAAGTATTVRIYREVFQKRQGVFQNLLSELDSGCKQIGLLADSANKGLEQGIGRIVEVSSHLERLEELSERIGLVIENARIEVLEGQSEALQLVEDSKKAFAAASELMNQAQKLSIQNNERLRIVLREFQDFYHTFSEQETSAEQLNQQLIEIHQRTEQFLALFNEISAEMTHADWLHAQGLIALSEGMGLQDAANQAWLHLVTLAQATLETIKDAKRTQEIGALREQLNEAAHGLSIERERLSALQQISRDMQQVIGDLSLEGQGFSCKQVAAGLAVASLTPGILPGIALGAATMAIMHDPSYLKTGLALLTGIRRRAVEDAEIIAYETDNIKVRFDTTSSGFWGTVVRRPSRTVGTVDVRIKNNTWISLHFDFRNPARPVDMTELARLMHALADAEIDHVIHILAELSLAHIDRGSRHEPITGFCPATSPFFAEVLSTHNRRLEEVAIEAERMNNHRSHHPHPPELLFFLDPSGGILGPIRGRGSRSSGTLSLRIGPERCFFHCNLLNRSPLTTHDLERLSQALVRGLEKGYISKKDAQELVKKILTIKIERAEAAPIRGLMTKRLLTYIAKELHPQDSEIVVDEQLDAELPEGTTITVALADRPFRLFYHGDIGTLELRIKELSISIDFNLEELEPVSEKSMLFLQTFLEDRIKAEVISSQQAKTILTHLQNTIVYDHDKDPHDLFRGDMIEKLMHAL